MKNNNLLQPRPLKSQHSQWTKRIKHNLDGIFPELSYVEIDFRNFEARQDAISELDRYHAKCAREIERKKVLEKLNSKMIKDMLGNAGWYHRAVPACCCAPNLPHFAQDKLLLLIDGKIFKRNVLPSWMIDENIHSVDNLFIGPKVSINPRILEEQLGSLQNNPRFSMASTFSKPPAFHRPTSLYTPASCGSPVRFHFNKSLPAAFHVMPTISSKNHSPMSAKHKGSVHTSDEVKEDSSADCFMSIRNSMMDLNLQYTSENREIIEYFDDDDDADIEEHEFGLNCNFSG